MSEDKIKLGTKCFKAKLDNNILMSLKIEMENLGIEKDIQKKLLNAVDNGINSAMYELENEPERISISYDNVKINNESFVFGNPDEIYERDGHLQKKLDE